MKLATAVSLIKKGIESKPSQRWADLGAGSGLFTSAIAELVGPESTVYSVDKNEVVLTKPSNSNSITIRPIKLDFVNGLEEIADLDGILMANSLHFVNDKVALVRKLSQHLKPDAPIILVEYDTDKANTWVPYPISFRNLIELVRVNNLGTCTKIGEAPSAYHGDGMYCAKISVAR